MYFGGVIAGELEMTKFCLDIATSSSPGSPQRRYIDEGQ